MKDLVYDENTEAKIIEKNFIEHSRWSILYEIIFNYQDKFYESSYCVGATEYQEEDPYEYEGDEIECYEVQPVEKTVMDYERVEQND